MSNISNLKKIIKKIIGRDGYSKLLNTFIGKQIHKKLHSNSNSSRDFLLRKMPEKSICAEIGVHIGDFSERILEIVQPKVFHLIDPWKLEIKDVYKKSYYGRETVKNQKVMDERLFHVKKRFEKEIKNNKIIINRGYSNEILNKFDDEYLDWVYIDGNHLYEFVKKDLEMCFLKIKNNGYICGDDYNEGGWWDGGVKKAVDEFILNNKNMKLIEIKANQFIIQKFI
jgi:hypothetical protein